VFTFSSYSVTLLYIIDYLEQQCSNSQYITSQLLLSLLTSGFGLWACSDRSPTFIPNLSPHCLFRGGRKLTFSIGLSEILFSPILDYSFKLLLLFPEQYDESVAKTFTPYFDFVHSNTFGNMLQACWLWTMIRSSRLPWTLEAAVFLRHFYVQVQQQSENSKFLQSKPFLNSSIL
jgi:hypothetical protein